MEAVRNFPDTELVANLQEGTRVDEMIRLIYRDYFAPLCWYVEHNSGTRADAEDMFQEVVVTFIDLVQKNRFRGESSIKTFLFSLNRHTWLNELKRRGRASLREEKFEHAQDRIQEDSGALISKREERQQLLSVVAALGEHCRKILVMYYYDNCTMREILGHTGYDSEQVVRNKKYKCLKQLEKMLNEQPSLKEALKNLLHG